MAASPWVREEVPTHNAPYSNGGEVTIFPLIPVHLAYRIPNMRVVNESVIGALALPPNHRGMHAARSVQTSCRVVLTLTHSPTTLRLPPHGCVVGNDVPPDTRTAAYTGVYCMREHAGDGESMQPERETDMRRDGDDRVGTDDAKTREESARGEREADGATGVSQVTYDKAKDDATRDPPWLRVWKSVPQQVW